MSVPSISVIIPTLNEMAALPDNLARLRNQPFLEHIVVDGGSSDGTAEFVREQADVTLITTQPGRGAQLNAGARVAAGDWLLFHHADTVLPDNGHELITAAAANSAVCWGGFQHRFSHRNWKLAVVSWLHNFRCRRTGVVYGDQSMFVQRRFFERLGGFPAQGLEDLEFSDTALEHSASVLLDAEVITDSRKFREMGEFRALAHVLSIIVRYQLGRRDAAGIGSFEFFKPYR